MKKLTIPKVRKIFSNYLKNLGYKEKTIKDHSRKIERFYGYLTEKEGITGTTKKW